MRAGSLASALSMTNPHPHGSVAVCDVTLGLVNSVLLCCQSGNCVLYQILCVWLHVQRLKVSWPQANSMPAVPMRASLTRAACPFTSNSRNLPYSCIETGRAFTAGGQFGAHSRRLWELLLGYYHRLLPWPRWRERGTPI